MVEIKIKGLRELQRKLKEMPKEIRKEMKRELIHWAEQIQALANQKVPPNLVQYRDTISFEVIETAKGIEISIKCDQAVSKYLIDAFEELEIRMPERIRHAIGRAIRKV